MLMLEQTEYKQQEAVVGECKKCSSLKYRQTIRPFEISPFNSDFEDFSTFCLFCADSLGPLATTQKPDI